jgi:hypothetical protein
LRRSHTFISASSAVDRFKLHLPPLFFLPSFLVIKKKEQIPGRKEEKKRLLIGLRSSLRRRIWRHAHPSQIKLARINFFAGLSLWWWTRYFISLCDQWVHVSAGPKVFFLFF